MSYISPPALFDEAPALPVEPPRANLISVIPAVAVAALALFGAGWYGGVTYATAEHDAKPAAAQVGRLQQAQTTCAEPNAGVSVADGGRTLTVDVKGEEDFVGTTTGTLDCVLQFLESPAAVTQHIYQTRALDGRQQNTWQTYAASWSYHPDSGLNLIVQAK
ncbi:hypothetical protein [Paractinoplanes rishiriensis]|uniref:Uncharacterized protein n=1 Tax=Paractinoplanes rishiriensis TaxID=1050105 RepID=A0A919MXX1_9ACTN|nr:hypothetical protein [Actinoplanes rishiriensis]GIE96260.1 hypothetical protein Ari01nite_37250 [Actinoplanes rishiriensis]